MTCPALALLVVGLLLVAAAVRGDGWTVHNLVGHPLSELLWLLGFERASHRVHDATLPAHRAGEGRG